MEGWIKLHRKLIDSSIFTSGDSFLLQLWIYILLKANHSDKKIIFNEKELTIQRGSGIFGLNQIVKDLTKYKRENSKVFKKMKTLYYRKLLLLKNIGNLKLQPTNKFTVVTVNNYDIYQSDVTPVKLQCNSTETPVLTNKNDNNVNNENNNIYKPQKTLNEKDFEEIAKQFNVSTSYVQQTYEKMLDWCKSKGKIYKDKKAALRNWIRGSNDLDKASKYIPIENRLSISELLKERRENV